MVLNKYENNETKRSHVNPQAQLRMRQNIEHQLI